MRKLLICAALAMPAIATTASAQPFGYAYGYNHHGRQVQQELRECNRELRRADSRREYRRELRECRRELARARAQQNRWNRGYSGYGYNRGYGSGYGYGGGYGHGYYGNSYGGGYYRGW